MSILFDRSIEERILIESAQRFRDGFTDSKVYMSANDYRMLRCSLGARFNPDKIFGSMGYLEAKCDPFMDDNKPEFRWE